ncbi:MAG: hypothetical protein K6G13_09820 [Agathobacter sp.]|uniref:papain-like cysteine protease family protein n=1 Tax=Agathobacter sp. TaxID=2021311 RepID=UPI00258D751E|nr:papain-like cysteine protease family protein [Agathobacter sp.]MCR5678313.1 hypothetical protein [Agathobacter sp.]
MGSVKLNVLRGLEQRKSHIHWKVAVVNVVSLLLTLLIIPNRVWAYQSDMSYKSIMIDRNIPESAKQYAEENYEDVLSVSKEFEDTGEIESVDDCYLDSSFIIVNLFGNTEPAYYFPVLEDEKVVFVVAVIETGDGYTISGDDVYVDWLNEIDYVSDKSLIFAICDDYIITKGTSDFYTYDDAAPLLEKEQEAIERFEKEEYRETVEYVANELLSLDENGSEVGKQTIKEGYTPSFAVNDMEGGHGTRICQLNGYSVSQNGRNMCWAASVATIVNYRKGTRYSAYSVCDLMNISYDQGATITQKKVALKKFGISYAMTDGVLAIGRVKCNIDNKYPIAMSCYSEEGAHAVTLYGYSCRVGGDYIVIRNPQKDTQITVKYNSGNVYFTSYGTKWKWRRTLSYYA